MSNDTDFTIADVLAWASTKPADESYDYTSNKNCAVCQFLRETGRAREPRVDPYEWWDAAKLAWVPYKLEALIDNAANGADNGEPNTFGAFAKRLEALLPKPIASSSWTKADAYLEKVSA